MNGISYVASRNPAACPSIFSSFSWSMSWRDAASHFVRPLSSAVPWSNETRKIKHAVKKIQMKRNHYPESYYQAKIPTLRRRAYWCWTKPSKSGWILEISIESHPDGRSSIRTIPTQRHTKVRLVFTCQFEIENAMLFTIEKNIEKPTINRFLDEFRST